METNTKNPNTLICLCDDCSELIDTLMSTGNPDQLPYWATGEDVENAFIFVEQNGPSGFFRLCSGFTRGSFDNGPRSKRNTCEMCGAPQMSSVDNFWLAVGSGPAPMSDHLIGNFRTDIRTRHSATK